MTGKGSGNSLFSNDIHTHTSHSDTTKSSLFGLTNDNHQRMPTSEQESSSISTLGGSLHQLTSEQIHKIISMKYKNDPILLIKQLSIDLANKETELILLRQEKFIREAQLYKLCNEYGNLSALEIDQKLNEIENKKKIPKQNDIDDILTGLIEVAMNNELPSSKDKPEIPTKLVPKENMIEKLTRPNRTRTHSAPVENPQSKIPEPQDTRGTNWITAPHKKWIKSFFISQEDLSSDQNRPVSKQTREELINSRTPVELASFANHDEELGSSTSIGTQQLMSEDINIDKYGFFTDRTNLRNTTATITTTTTNGPNNSNPATASPIQMNNSFTEDKAILITNSESNNKLQFIDKLKEMSQAHDIINDKFEQDWNKLIQDINRTLLQSHHPTIIPTSSPSTFPTFGIKGYKLLSISSILFNNIKQLINTNGIPTKYRAWLWMELSGANEYKVNGEYQALLDQPADEIQTYLDQIELDLDRTLPFNYYFNNLIELKRGVNYYKLKRILYAFVQYCPKVGYVQGMNKIIGTLLLSNNNVGDGNHHLVEEDVFWLFVGLVEEILPKYDGGIKVFFDDLGNIHRDNLIISKRYLYKFQPELWLHFEKLGLEIEVIIMNWWLCLFIDLKFINLDTWFKLFDNLLIGDNRRHHLTGLTTEEHHQAGPDISQENEEHQHVEDEHDYRSLKFISITLAILQCLSHILLTMNDKDEIHQFLSTDNNFKLVAKTSSTTTPNKYNLKFSDLIKHQLHFFGKLSTRELRTYRKDINQS
ncbi:uncharacterized protein J8A68_001936 [[Candida] subhashii]|uniref:Rab-GAP TBC domain-containing protein n=1 Tax=[Candida] subhashii TaxID=561895 RepID=A0A8J5QH12_9ASCO|nr:uncharacterized protein J8A68_001936 [[Candida] subhashii]KAG7664536.1 hypothetical protein J8A68_001936 [[Candida] subhashii]